MVLDAQVRNLGLNLSLHSLPLIFNHSPRLVHVSMYTHTHTHDLCCILPVATAISIVGGSVIYNMD